MKAKAKNIRMLILWTLLAVFIFTMPFCFPFWNNYFADYNLGLGIDISDFNSAYNPLDRLPESTPPEVIDRLESLTENYPDDVINALVDGIISVVVNDPNFDGSVRVSAELEGFFEEGKTPLSNNDLLIYTIEKEDGSFEFAMIHISEDSNFGNITSLDELMRALEQPWAGVNEISSVWIRGNLYTTFNTSVEYNGKYYLLLYNGPSGNPPAAAQEWFEVMPGYQFNSSNTYYTGYIVQHSGNYYIANWHTSGTAPNSSSAWTVINEWQSQTYSAGSFARTGTRFWRALQTTSLAPNEDSAAAGHWREISNGWIGRSGDNVIKNYYFAHNTYTAGDIAIYGISARLHYRYFKVKDGVGTVPAGQAPLVEKDGLVQINEDYWEAWI